MNGFRGGFGGKQGGMQMQQLLKQAQKMQEDLAKKQEEVENSTATGVSGGGMVSVEINGKKEMLSLKINREIVDPEDTEMLEDMIIAAFNEASNKIDEIKKNTMGEMGNLPF